MPRWISDNPRPSLPWVAQTIIAGWLPTKYFLVATLEYLGATGEDPMKKLTRSFASAAPKNEYIVQVFKCDRYGMPNPRDPYFESSHATKQEGIESHREVVKLLSVGKLPLKRIVRETY